MKHDSVVKAVKENTGGDVFISVIYVTFTGRCSNRALERVLSAIRFFKFLPCSGEDKGKRAATSRIGGSFSVSSLMATASAWNADLIMSVGRNCSVQSSHYSFHFPLLEHIPDIM